MITRLLLWLNVAAGIVMLAFAAGLALDHNWRGVASHGALAASSAYCALLMRNMIRKERETKRLIRESQERRERMEKEWQERMETARTRP